MLLKLLYYRLMASGPCCVIGCPDGMTCEHSFFEQWAFRRRLNKTIRARDMYRKARARGMKRYSAADWPDWIWRIRGLSLIEWFCARFTWHRATVLEVADDSGEMWSCWCGKIGCSDYGIAATRAIDDDGKPRWV